MLTDSKALFGLMVEKQISYIHLVPGSPVMLRQKSVFVPLDTDILIPQQIKDFIESILTDIQKGELEQKKELEISYSIPGVSRFRISVFTQRGTLSAIIFMNPIKIPTPEELMLPDFLKNTVLNLHHGLIAIIGPKGSGKSYTLAALINYILENRHCQVLSLENPINFLYKNKKGVICQREIGTDVLSYQHALSGTLHQDIDILAITQVDSYKVASHLLNISCGGGLVLMTFQSPTVSVFLEQFVDLFPPYLQEQARILLSIGLESVVSQTLCVKSTGEGLIPAFEILMCNAQVKNLITEGKFIQIQSYMATSGRESGMQTQEQALRFLVKKNLVTQQEAQSKAVRPEEFRKIISLPY